MCKTLHVSRRRTLDGVGNWTNKKVERRYEGLIGAVSRIRRGKIR